uniref:Ribosome biogenesis protein BRX1 homolog n=1 Tax=Romanomermis culicivorax TaxID=13658 RepID=A0A915IEL2_ROMCU
MEFDKDAINEEEQIPLKRKWSNRERVLVISSRGITFRNRHLMNDLKTLLPHSKGDSKVDKKEKVVCLNEVAEMRNCSKCIYFESRKKDDLYMWMANVDGPSFVPVQTGRVQKNSASEVIPF